MSLQAIRGTRDIFGPEMLAWHRVEEIFRDVTRSFSYEEFRTPIIESTELFKRGVGEETDIVGKEMYTFDDRGGDSITLRPEMTAPIVRAMIEHSILHHHPLTRLWYAGPQFRYERPQKGRYRQFHQFGAECIGSAHPESDVEIILLAHEVLRRTGLKSFILELNSLGTASVRQSYRQALVEYLTQHQDELSDDSQRRITTNPLRVLDSKDEKDQSIIAAAPLLSSFYDESSAAHFAAVRTLLDVAGIPYVVNPLLVRGLDYYNQTVFEFTTTALGTQNAIGGGGRYDPLFAKLGGGDVPAVGFSIGIERVILLLEAEQGGWQEEQSSGVYLCAIGEDAILPVQTIAFRLRRAGIHVITDLQRRSMKAQMKEANRQRVKWTVMIGENELANSTAVVKSMETGEQQTVAQHDLETHLIGPTAT